MKPFNSLRLKLMLAAAALSLMGVNDFILAMKQSQLSLGFQAWLVCRCVAVACLSYVSVFKSGFLQCLSGWTCMFLAMSMPWVMVLKAASGTPVTLGTVDPGWGWLMSVEITTAIGAWLLVFDREVAGFRRQLDSKPASEALGS